MTATILPFPTRPAPEDGIGMPALNIGELAAAFGIEGHMANQGVSIPSGGDYRAEYVARARGEQPTVVGKPYWD